MGDKTNRTIFAGPLGIDFDADGKVLEVLKNGQASQIFENGQVEQGRRIIKAGARILKVDDAKWDSNSQEALRNKAAQKPPTNKDEPSQLPDYKRYTHLHYNVTFRVGWYESLAKAFEDKKTTIPELKEEYDNYTK